MKIAHRRHDLIGDVLPAAGREIVPWEEAELQAQRQAAPIINVSFPRADNEREPGAMTWERRTAQREPSLESDIVVPVGQAAMTAFAVMLAAGAGCLVWGWPARVMLIAGCIAVLVAWLVRLRVIDSLLWATETLTGHDMNGDGKVGQPASFTLANPAQARQAARQDVDATEQAAQRAELLAFVHRCYVTGTAETAHGVKAGGPDRDVYLRQRDVLMALGIASWKNPARPKGGWKMTVSYARATEIIGRHVL